MPKEINGESNSIFMNINSEGFLYISSKEPKEGWKKIEMEHGRS